MRTSGFAQKPPALLPSGSFALEKAAAGKQSEKQLLWRQHRCSLPPVTAWLFTRHYILVIENENEFALCSVFSRLFFDSFYILLEGFITVRSVVFPQTHKESSGHRELDSLRGREVLTPQQTTSECVARTPCSRLFLLLIIVTNGTIFFCRQTG